VRAWPQRLQLGAAVTVAVLVAAFAGFAGAARRWEARGGWAAAAREGGAETCDELMPAAARGKRIFRKGITAAGRPVEGVLDGSAAVLSGVQAACAGCHSPDGAGASEGGALVPAVVREQLFSASRGRGPYDAVTLATAIRDGRSPTRQLHGLMPRYRLAPEELDDVVAYLRCVGHDSDPGVTAEAVTLGAALPLTGRSSTVGAAVREMLEASFAEVNAQGGIFRRRIELTVEDSGERGEEGATARLVGRGVFALVGSVAEAGGARAALGARLEAEGVPLIGPVSAEPPEASRSDGVVFEVEPGLDTLARVAVKHVADSVAPPGPGQVAATVLVLRPRGAEGESWLGGARAEAAVRGLRPPVDVPYEHGRLDESGLAEGARSGGVRAVLFLGGADELSRCAAALEADAGSRLAAKPGAAVIYAPASVMGDAGDALWTARLRRVVFIYPGPLDAAETGRQRAFDAFLQSHGIAQRHVALQRRARVAAGLVIEALKRTGAHVTRDGLIAALDGLRDFDAGAGPALSFGKHRRAGVMGASLIQVDPERRDAVRASEWIEVVP
jgi:ABC-type branched-subunit amino acid transport system substrate-binding protein